MIQMATSLKVISTTDNGTDSGLVTEAVITVPAANAAQALDRALNMMERYTELTGTGFSIEGYGATMTDADENGLWFEVHVY